MNGFEMKLGKEYFNKLDEMIDFYSSLSFSVMGWSTQGTRSLYNIDSYVYSSMEGTLDSIKIILQNGRLNDSYSLLRKYYDSCIINIYSNLYLSDNFSLKNFIVAKIDNWLNGKEKLPEYRVMSQYIRNSNKLREINSLLRKDDRYKEIRDRCNNYTHYNYFQSVLLNDNELRLTSRVKVLNTFASDIEQVFILHLSYLFYFNDHYMMSSDYVDSLEMGMKPEEDSLFYVAPFIQETFSHFLKKQRPDIAEFIKSNTEMKLE